MLLALILSQAITLPNPAGPIITNPATMVSWAAFEALPANGAGTSGVCSTTAPSGATGQVLTATRASTAACTKATSGGLSTTGIANGDLVTLSTNVIRVEYDFAGKLKLRGEPSRTNSARQSEALDDAVWVYSNSDAPRLPVLNGANTVVAPDGTTTAEDYSFAAIAGTADYGYRYQPGGCPPGVAATLSCYERSISGGTTTDLTIETGAGAWTSAPCTISTSSWTRCSLPNITTRAVAAAFYVGVGEVSVVTTRSAARVAIWGCQCEASSYLTSYAATGAGTATRAADLAQFAISGISTAAGFSLSMKSVSPATNEGGVWGAIGSIYQDALNRTQFYRVAGNAVNGDVFSTSGNRSASSLGLSVFTANTEEKFGLTYTGAGASSVATAYRAGSVVATSAAGLTSAFSPTIFYPFGLGAQADTTQLVGEFCFDTSLTKCLR